MHHCLRILELFPLGTLAALAAVCKEFETPALDYLWSEQASLLPLINCMPGDLRRCLAKRRNPQRPVISSDLTRLLKYSSRVRAYRRSGWQTAFESDALFQTFYTTIPQSALFPNIKTLEWVDDSFESAQSRQWIPFFLGPKLLNIVLDVHVADHLPTLSLLARVKIHCPLIQQASLTIKHSPELLDTRIRLVSDAVRGWRRLSSLTVQSLDASTWLHLSRLETLRVLVIGRFGWYEGALIRWDLGARFSSLRQLRVEKASIYACAQLFRHFSKCPMEKFVAGVDSYGTIDHWRELFLSMERGCSHPTLKTITINFTVRPPDGLVDRSVLARTRTPGLIIPLFSFPNLISICVDFPYKLILETDPRLRAWSRLESLNLGATLECQIRGLRGLIKIAEYCPNLRQLTIFVDTTAMVPNSDDFFQIKSKGISNKHLRRLNVGESIVNHTTLAVSASVISMIFPSLQFIAAEDESKEFWALVMQMGPQLASVHAGYDKIITSLTTRS
ncbi:hypothetical protein C8R44DRAFT_737349 [Mycena epipterygia]|nr:hypothetical protein C8R44DRAFT_737349 [Mycena epipterygia]